MVILGRGGVSYERGTPVHSGAAFQEPLGPYTRNMPWALWWSQGGGLFLISEVPLYTQVRRFKTQDLERFVSSRCHVHLFTTAKMSCFMYTRSIKEKKKIKKKKKRKKTPTCNRSNNCSADCEAVPGGLVFKARRLLYHSTLGRE